MMKNILIVEDQAATYYSLEFILQKEGYLPIIAKDIKIATKIIQEQTIDLVLLDFNLPDGRGDNFLYTLRQEYHLDVPVILMSASSQLEMTMSMVDLGADHYLHKPFSLNDLLVVIKDFLVD